MLNVLILITLLITKHFILDFVYQPPYQWQNKGTYGHLGGIIHAGQHAITTFAILLFFTSPALAALLGLAEMLLHYHIDWFKMWYGKRKQWKADTHNEFWILMGFDQYLHYITYVLICGIVFL